MSHHATQGEFISVTRAAKLADVDASTVWKWIKSGTLASFKLPSGRTRVRRRDIVRPSARAAS